MRVVLLWGPVWAAIALTLIVTLQPFVDPRLVFLDPLAAAQTGACCKAYFGAMSTLGVMLWAGAAGVCAIAAAVLIREGSAQASFFLAATALTGWLGLDDALMIHETVGPRLGLAQNLLLAIYAGLGALYVWSARARLFRPGGLLLAVALTGFAASLGVDVVLHSTHSQIAAIEDSAKFVGIMAWLMFHGAAAFEALSAPRGDRSSRA